MRNLLLAAVCLVPENQATEAELREMFSMDEDDGPLYDRIEVCAGYWQRSADVWLFHDETGDEE